jgi:hypothetical protein
MLSAKEQRGEGSVCEMHDLESFSGENLFNTKGQRIKGSKRIEGLCFLPLCPFDPLTLCVVFCFSSMTFQSRNVSRPGPRLGHTANNQWSCGCGDGKCILTPKNKAFRLAPSHMLRYTARRSRTRYCDHNSNVHRLRTRHSPGGFAITVNERAGVPHYRLRPLKVAPRMTSSSSSTIIRSSPGDRHRGRVEKLKRRRSPTP